MSAISYIHAMKITGNFLSIARQASVIFFILFGSLPVCSQPKSSSSDFKIVGYYFLNAALRDTTHSDTTYWFLDKITHLNIAFINPDSSGNFPNYPTLSHIINAAQDKKVKVLASIAGGGSHPYYKNLLQANNRRIFIDNLVEMMDQYGFDGIDVDLEGNDIDNNYGDFIKELSNRLKKKKKLMTAAIATAYKDQLPDKALRRFDFLNIMSYDQTGPWRPTDPGNHSPYSMAAGDLHYWNSVRHLPKEKLILGLPFYGYGFGAADIPVLSLDYKSIRSLYPEVTSDTILFPGNVTMYFNNMATIIKKTELAKKEAGGVMIWQLLGDARGDRSLLNAIDAIRKRESNQ